MLTLSYVCVSLSVISLVIVLIVIDRKEKKRILRYHGTSKKKLKR